MRAITESSIIFKSYGVLTLLAGLCLGIPNTAQAQGFERGYMGFNVRMGDRLGIYVTHVQSPSPAMQAGLRAGDWIVAVNGQSVTGFAAQMQERTLASIRYNQIVTLSVRRNGVLGTLRVRANHFARGYMGIRVNLGDRNGIEVLDFLDVSPARDVGLRPGDWIVAINGRTVTGPNAQYQSEALMEIRRGQIVLLSVRRGGKPRTFHVPATAPAPSPNALPRGNPDRGRSPDVTCERIDLDEYWFQEFPIENGEGDRIAVISHRDQYTKMLYIEVSMNGRAPRQYETPYSPARGVEVATDWDPQEPLRHHHTLTFCRPWRSADPRLLEKAKGSFRYEAVRP